MDQRSVPDFRAQLVRALIVVQKVPATMRFVGTRRLGGYLARVLARSPSWRSAFSPATANSRIVLACSPLGVERKKCSSAWFLGSFELAQQVSCIVLDPRNIDFVNDDHPELRRPSLRLDDCLHKLCRAVQTGAVAQEAAASQRHLATPGGPGRQLRWRRCRSRAATADCSCPPRGLRRAGRYTPVTAAVSRNRSARSKSRADTS